ncbi:Fusaric acid resistance protein-like [Actinacidiphila rubida]|uniref:Fusaric acid resistance protein-like n=2 Tax=Actinacidiphila rubida TaxID=310780 RepID=A0A1H8QUL5_9ACTN|nr:FUSC family protein [Actinacidiphila rubida]SEO57726.1 Fusaric acid resistance protein-like [Actinacidiphila rubida]
MSTAAERADAAEAGGGRKNETPPRIRRWVHWVGAHDPGLSALRRALRAAIITPSLFAVAFLGIGNPVIAVFAAFAPMVLMLFVDFSGPMRERVAEQASLALVSVALVGLGSLAGQVVWVAGVAAFVVTFAIQFGGVLSSALAGARAPLLISFVLPATLVAPVGAVPDRLAGWSMGAAATVLAVRFMWPRPVSEPLRDSTARACALLARQLRLEVPSAGPSARRSDRDAAARAAADGVDAMKDVFYATPNRPTGLSTSARALVRMTSTIHWLHKVVAEEPLERADAVSTAAVREVALAAAEVLESGAELLKGDAGPSGAGSTGAGPSAARPDPSADSAPPPAPAPDSSAGLEARMERLDAARRGLQHVLTEVLPERLTPSELAGALASGFRAERRGSLAASIASDVRLAVLARQRSWWQRVRGSRPVQAQSDLSSARDRLVGHLDWHSVWLHNSLRGAAALSAAVVLAQLTGVQHAFWVVFGTLAVLRSSAVNTGQTVGRALLGTAIGFVLGVALIVALASHPVVLWLLLPPAIVLIGLEPSVMSFTAGQAGFTVVLLILFTIVDPAGWEVGLVRIKDMALGCAVSLVVGALFWPRGSGPALGRVLSEAFGDGARYLRTAVAFGLTRCDGVAVTAPDSDADRRRAAASARRVDDAFRGYLAERGTKRLALPDVTSLVTTVSALRLTGNAIVDLWARAGYVARSDRFEARVRIIDACENLAGWFELSGRALAGTGSPAPAEPMRRPVADRELQRAVRHDLTDARSSGDGASTAVRLVWTANHLDGVRRLQTDIVAPIHAAATLPAPVTTPPRHPLHA